MHHSEQPQLRRDETEQSRLRPDTAGRSRPETTERQDRGFLGPRRRRLAWVGFLLLAAYAPVVAWLTPDDSWLMPIAVAGVVGYVIIVDDMLRHRGLRPMPGHRPDTPTRDRPLDGPGSSGSDGSERESSSG